MKYAELFEKSPAAVVYHGTASHFDQFDDTKARSPNDLYGGGIAYFTDSFPIAQSYSRAAKRRKNMPKDSEPTVIKAQLNLKKTFDIDQLYSSDIVKKIIKISNIKMEDFLRGAGLLRLGGKDQYQLETELDRGELKLTGKQIFYGISGGGAKSTHAREILKKAGFDSLRYTGGEIMGGEKHNVWLPFYKEQINILT